MPLVFCKLQEPGRYPNCNRQTKNIHDALFFLGWIAGKAQRFHNSSVQVVWLSVSWRLRYQPRFSIPCRPIPSQRPHIIQPAVVPVLEAVFIGEDAFRNLRSRGSSSGWSPAPCPASKRPRNLLDAAVHLLQLFVAHQPLQIGGQFFLRSWLPLP